MRRELAGIATSMPRKPMAFATSSRPLPRRFSTSRSCVGRSKHGTGSTPPADVAALSAHGGRGLMLVGAMFTAPPQTSDAELDARLR